MQNSARFLLARTKNAIILANNNYVRRLRSTLTKITLSEYSNSSSSSYLLKNNCQIQYKKKSIRYFSTYPLHEIIPMPALSPTMDSGTIAKWNKKEGDSVAAGDIICEVETDKATVDYEAQDDFIIAKILVKEGQADVKVGQPIFISVEEHDSVSAFNNYSIGDDFFDTKNVSESPESNLAQNTSIETETETEKETKARTSRTSQSSEECLDRIFASPLARKTAREAGISVVGLSGTGPKGRIIFEDVISALKSQTTNSTETKPKLSKQSKDTSSVPSLAQSNDEFMDFPISDLAKKLAQEMSQQKRDVPHYHLSIDLTMDKILNVREKLNSSRSDGEKLSVNDFIIKAASLAIKKVPAVNAAWMGSFIRQFKNSNISFTVSVGGGSIAPVIKTTNIKGLHEINKNIKTIMENVSDGKVTNDDTKNGTFTISNVGMYDVKSLASIISPNQACSLGLGKIEKCVVPNDDPNAEQIYKYATMMTATLACDHRVIDGATGAQWLAAFKNLVEEPLHMML